jgi:hypothetical protein
MTPNAITTEAEFRRLLGLPERGIDRIEGEMSQKPHLAGDLRHVRQIAKAETRDARQARTAAEAMGRIPAGDEALHLAISGRFALWHFVEAALSLAGCNGEPSILQKHRAGQHLRRSRLVCLPSWMDRRTIREAQP